MRSSTRVVITLELTLAEARWLLGVVHAPLRGESPYEEPYRLDLWNALYDALESVDALESSSHE